MEFNVSAVVKYNDISDELKEIIRKALPQRGQTFTFMSVRPKARGTTVVPTDRIFDPWKNGTGEYVDIAYEIGQEPGKGPIIGRIQFTRTEGGVIQIRGGDRRDENLFAYLFLTNQREGSVNEPWHVKGRQQIFRLLKPAQTAAQKLEFERRIYMAMQDIDKMGDNTLRDFALGLDMKGINQFSSADEIRLKLYEIAKKDPDKVRALSHDKMFEIKVLVKEAEKFGVIKRDDQLQQYVWPDSGETVCVASPGKELREALIMFLLSINGQPTLELIQKLLRAKKNPQPIVTIQTPNVYVPPAETASPAPSTTFTTSSTPAPAFVTTAPKKGPGRRPGFKNKEK